MSVCVGMTRDLFVRVPLHSWIGWVTSLHTLCVCGTWLMTHSWVRLDTWLMRMWDMTRSCVRCIMYVCVTCWCHAHEQRRANWHTTIHMRARTHTFVCMCRIWRYHICAPTILCVHTYVYIYILSYHIYTRTRSLCIRTYMYINLYMCGTWWRSRVHAYNVAITLKNDFRYTHMHPLHIYVQIDAYIHMHDLVEITDARLESCIHMYKFSNMHTHSLHIYIYMYICIIKYIHMQDLVEITDTRLQSRILYCNPVCLLTTVVRCIKPIAYVYIYICIRIYI